MPASRRDDLIEAALQVFMQHGFHASGLDRILKQGGISRMTLYNHFKGKDELIVAALNRHDQRSRQQMHAAINAQTADPVGQLLAVFAYYADWLGQGGSLNGCLFQNAAAEFEAPDSPIRQAVAANKHATLAYLTDRCRAAEAADPTTLGMQLNALLQGMVSTAHSLANAPAPVAPGAPAAVVPNARVELQDITRPVCLAAEALIEAALAATA